jgi:hypothetical protein
LNDCEIEIDERPMIPAYLEIEWENEEAVKETLKMLNIKWHITTSENTTAVYKRYWINNLEEIKELKF